MLRALFICVAALGLVSSALADSSNIDKVNGSIAIAAGESAGKLSTVNGSIKLADGARADRASTVNGSIDLGPDANARSAETVNGHVALAERARIEGGVDTVNGAITLARGAVIGGKLSNVNGSIRVEGGEVGGGIETVNGDILIGADSHVRGGILMTRSSGWFNWFKGWFGAGSNPRVVIGPRAVVEGELDFQRAVDLFVSDSARIGTLKGATAQMFSGDAPAP